MRLNNQEGGGKKNNIKQYLTCWFSNKKKKRKKIWTQLKKHNSAPFFFFWFKFSAVHVHSCVPTAVTLVSLIFRLLEFWTLRSFVVVGFIFLFVFRQAGLGRCSPWTFLAGESSSPLSIMLNQDQSLTEEKPAKEVSRFQINNLVLSLTSYETANGRMYRGKGVGGLDE